MIRIPSFLTVTVALIVLAYLGMLFGETSVLIASGVMATGAFAIHIIERRNNGG